MPEAAKQETKQSATRQPEFRPPQAGDEVRFVGFSRTATPLYAIVARTYGHRVVNLAYLSESGQFLSATDVRYSAEKADGTWHWPDPRG